MKANNQKTLKLLVNTLRFYGWVKVLRLPGKNMLVADPDFITELRSQVSNLECDFSVPNSAIDDIKKSDAKRITVLCKNNEIGLVKKLRQTFPNRQILSTQYDLCPRSFIGPYTKPDHNNGNLPDAIVISSPSSDIEYPSHIVEENNIAVTTQLFGKAAHAIMKYADDFQPTRYIASYFNNSLSDDAFNITNIDIKHLEAFIENTTLTFLKVKRFIERYEIKVVYFQRRDKIRQAAVNALLNEHASNSVWSLPPASYANFATKRSIGFVIAVNSLHETIAQEARIERFLSQLPSVQILILEELIKVPEVLIDGLLNYLGITKPSKLTISAYEDIFPSIVGFDERIAGFKREYIDRLGLHVNDAGSLITETEKILTKK